MHHDRQDLLERGVAAQQGVEDREHETGKGEAEDHKGDGYVGGTDVTEVRQEALNLG